MHHVWSLIYLLVAISVVFGMLRVFDYLDERICEKRPDSPFCQFLSFGGCGNYYAARVLGVFIFAAIFFGT